MDRQGCERDNATAKTHQFLTAIESKCHQKCLWNRFPHQKKRAFNARESCGFDPRCEHACVLAVAPWSDRRAHLHDRQAARFVEEDLNVHAQQGGRGRGFLLVLALLRLLQRSSGGEGVVTRDREDVRAVLETQSINQRRPRKSSCGGDCGVNSPGSRRAGRRQGRGMRGACRPRAAQRCRSRPQAAARERRSAG